jgi:hypothetical protein
MALYIAGLPFYYKRLPNPQHRLVHAAMLMGWILALVWPLLATLISLGIVRLNLDTDVEMMIWSVGAAWFSTWLAYEVSGQGNLVENASRPTLDGEA